MTAILDRCQGIWYLRFRDTQSRSEWQLNIWIESVPVGYGVYAWDQKETLIGEHKTSLFFGENRIGIVHSVDRLGEWFFQDMAS